MVDGPITLSLSGYTPLPKGKIASIVTSLEMRRPFPEERRAPEAVALLRRVPEPGLDWYRALYRSIGEDWLWFSRLQMTDAELERTLRDPAVEVYAITGPNGDELGLVELDFREAGQCELAFFGLVPSSVGHGLGRTAMAEALHLVAASGVERLWVHTCTLDHPGALAFYLKSGFAPFARSIEVADDPRVTGALPRSAAPHVPIID
jgi:GNAT superfamily N-acetyltransferase